MIAQLDKAFIKARPWKLWSRLLAYGLFEGRPLTTKGQWFNPVVFGFFKLCRLVQYKKHIDDPVFIVGMGRSGTTALGSVLSMHREIAYLNEPKALWHSINDNEDLIGSYSTNIGRYRLDPDSLDCTTIAAISNVYKTLLKLTGSSKIVDKYPELLFRIPYVLALFPNAKFIMLTRNGFDNCRSIAKWCDVHASTKGDSTYDWWGSNDRKWNAICDQLIPEHEDLFMYKEHIENYQHNFDKACVEWIITMREVSTAMRKYPTSVIQVDYDDLCSEPRNVLRKILTAVDLESTDEVLNEYAEQTLARKSLSNSCMKVDIYLQKAFSVTMNNFAYESTKT